MARPRSSSLKQYVRFGHGHIRSGRNVLLILPLTIITIFCFGFVLMHPVTSNTAASRQNNSTGKSKGLKVNTTEKATKLETLPVVSDSAPATAEPAAQPKASPSASGQSNPGSNSSHQSVTDVIKPVTDKLPLDL